MARLAAQRSRSDRVLPRHAAPVFSALGDETRLNVVARLSSSGPLSIVRLTEGARVTRQAVTKHLHVLAAAGLLRRCREGREQVWEIRPKRLIEAREYLDRISDQWDEVIERLRELVEKET
jgi:DNA-binding transcriptional ArsR family regulator